MKMKNYNGLPSRCAKLIELLVSDGIDPKYASREELGMYRNVGKKSISIVREFYGNKLSKIRKYEKRTPEDLYSLVLEYKRRISDIEKELSLR